MDDHRSLMEEALADAGVPLDSARSDRQLLVEVLAAATKRSLGPQRPRWAVVMDLTAHGSGVSQAICRAAGLDPDEMVGGYAPEDLNLTAVCRECGEGVALDEDGCCSCGADAVVVDGRGSAEVLTAWLEEAREEAQRYDEERAAAEEAAEAERRRRAAAERLYREAEDRRVDAERARDRARRDAEDLEWRRRTGRARPWER